MAFYLNEYKDILKKLLKLTNHKWLTITQAKQLIDNKSQLLKKAIIIRHDVDRSPYNALKMAQLEANIGIKATYYFRCNSSGDFDRNFIQKIAKLGHEVGYHYECLSYCDGDKEKALKNFEQNLSTFRTIAKCTSVAMHGAPLSRHHNQDLLISLNLNVFNLEADAVLSFADIELVYLTDTGGSWNSLAHHNLRDHVGISTNIPLLPSDEHFLKWIDENEQPFMLSTHPERWATGLINFIFAETRDRISNFAKYILRLIRKSKKND